jgi:hypothetical protein
MSYFAEKKLALEDNYRSAITYSIPLVYGVARSLALVLPSLHDGKTGTRDTEHLSLNELLYRAAAGSDGDIHQS